MIAGRQRTIGTRNLIDIAILLEELQGTLSQRQAVGMFGKGFGSLCHKVYVAFPLSSAQATIQVFHLLLADLLWSAFRQDASSANVVEVVEVLGCVVAHLIEHNLAQGGNGLSLQTYIIIIGGRNDCHLRFGIAEPLQLLLGEQRTFLGNAFLCADGLFAKLVEGTVIAATLTEAHLLDIADQQLNLIVGSGGDLLQEAVGSGIVHTDHSHKGQVVQCLGALGVVGARLLEHCLRVALGCINVTVVRGIGTGIQPIHRSLVGR